MTQVLDEGNTNRVGEGNGSFNFEEWITKYNLSEIKDCFIQNDMNSLNALNMDNCNFKKLMADERILTKSYLIPKIIEGMQSLKELRQNENKKNNNNINKLVFMTEKENNVFIRIQDYIKELNQFENDWEEIIKNNFEIKKSRDSKKLKIYKQINTENLDKMNENIEVAFEQLHNLLTEKEKLLKLKIREYKTEFIDIENKYDDKINELTKTINNTFILINNDKKYCTNSIKLCKEIINKHHSQSQIGFDFKSKNEEREKDIIEIGELIQENYHIKHSKLIENKNIMKMFVEKELNVNTNEKNAYGIYLLDINEQIYNRIVSDLNGWIRICTCKDDDNLRKYVDEIHDDEDDVKQNYNNCSTKQGKGVRFRGRIRGSIRRGRGRLRGRGRGCTIVPVITPIEKD